MGQFFFSPPLIEHLTYYKPCFIIIYVLILLLLLLAAFIYRDICTLSLSTMKGAYTYYAPLIIVVVVIIISCFHSKGVACNYAPRPNIGVGGGNQINYGLLPFCPLSIGEIGKELFFIGRTEKKKTPPKHQNGFSNCNSASDAAPQKKSDTPWDLLTYSHPHSNRLSHVFKRCQCQ